MGHGWVGRDVCRLYRKAKLHCWEPRGMICVMMRSKMGSMVIGVGKVIDFAGGVIGEASRPAATSWGDGRDVLRKGRTIIGAISGTV